MPAPLPVQTALVEPAAPERALSPQPSTLNQLARLGLFLLVLSACFWRPLLDLARLATSNDLYSHVLLVPVISVYLVWIRRTKLVYRNQRRLSGLAMIPAVFGVVLLGGYFSAGTGLRTNDYLAITVLAYVCFVTAGAISLFGPEMVRQLMFPLCFLVFMVPFPTFLENGIEVFFQYASAEAAALLFNISGTPTVREGLVFQVPGVTLRVAQECSGIRSSLVLFITSLVAGHIFLGSPWKRALLAFFVIPLGIVRNAFRIWVLATLCNLIDPGILNSPLHHRGGPIFFALSLIPFFALLLWLWYSERRAHTHTPTPTLNPVGRDSVEP